MKQRSEVAADRAASYLREMGIRPSSKAYQYLLFALTQLQCGTPFQNSIWELTAIHFGQKRENDALAIFGACGVRLPMLSVWHRIVSRMSASAMSQHGRLRVWPSCG